MSSTLGDAFRVLGRWARDARASGEDLSLFVAILEEGSDGDVSLLVVERAEALASPGLSALQPHIRAADATGELVVFIVDQARVLRVRVGFGTSRHN